jgi:hypothetical protein
MVGLVGSEFSLRQFYGKKGSTETGNIIFAKQILVKRNKQKGGKTQRVTEFSKKIRTVCT